MSRLDAAINQAAAQTRKGPPCTVGALLHAWRDTDPELAESLQRHLDSRLRASVIAAALGSMALPEGFTAPQSGTIERHRRSAAGNGCVCSR
jgi:hypothetical protein